MKEIVIGEKRYYSISEAARITGLEQYVLRYWEKEFPTLKPQPLFERYRYCERRTESGNLGS